MKSLSREAILRMVGLHDAAHMVRQLNAIQLSLEEEQGKMVAYWTEIRKTEKEVTLIAGRMDDAETDIAQLQVTAGQISASVSSLQTTVSGHTEQIASLTITTNSITQSVSSLTTTVNGHTSQISTLRTDLNGISATVTADHTTLGTHTTQIGSLQVTTNSISGRVTAIEGDYVKEAEISLMVKYDPNTGYISNALIKADDIDFVFTRAVSWYWQSKAEANKRMGLDSSGDLWIKGEYRGGSITGNITVGTGTNKMYIRPNETDGAELVGYYGNYQTILLGFGAETPAQGVTANVGRLTLSSYVSGSLYRKSVLGPGHFSIFDSSNNLIAQFSAGSNLINGSITVYINGTTYSGVTRNITIGGTTLRITSGIITGVS